MGYTAAERKVIEAMRASNLPKGKSFTVTFTAAPEVAAPPPVNTFYAKVIKGRIPCAYGSPTCPRFAPNGVGPTQHTTCAQGAAALKAAQAARKAARA